MTRLFVTGTGTGVGKTWVTRGLARALAQRGADVVAIKPIETGCDPDPLDALALAKACGRPGAAHAPGLYRARPPLAPAAATLEGVPPPELERIAGAVEAQERAFTLVEGAGGVLVPIDSERDVLDLVARLGASVLLVGADQLGVLSHVLTAALAVTTRGLPLAAVVLRQVPSPDLSARTNRQLLAARLPCPVLTFPTCPDDDDALADAALPLARALGWLP